METKINNLMNEIISENHDLFDFPGECISNEELDKLESLLEVAIENNKRKQNNNLEQEYINDQFRFAENFLEKWK